MNSGTIAYGISDHDTVCTAAYSQTNNHKMRLKPHLPLASTQTKVSNFNEENFLSMLEPEKLNFQKYNSLSIHIQERFSHLADSFGKCLEAHAPMQKLSRQQTKRYLKPWLTKKNSKIH